LDDRAYPNTFHAFPSLETIIYPLRPTATHRLRNVGPP
jgi:hypothetical protein